MNNNNVGEISVEFMAKILPVIASFVNYTYMYIYVCL